MVAAPLTRSAQLAERPVLLPSGVAPTPNVELGWNRKMPLIEDVGLRQDVGREAPHLRLPRLFFPARRRRADRRWP